MNVSDKWKSFACCQILSDWSAKISAPALFDLMRDAENEDLRPLFDDHGVTVWHPFEYWELCDIADLITEMATRAHQTESEVTA